MLGGLRSLWRVLSRRRSFEAGMTEELRFHIEEYTQDLIRSGLSPQEAERQARIEFGGVNTVQEECREARRLHLFDALGRESRYAVRLLRKSPGFTITATLTIALCLGANLTIFAVMDSILLRPLPFPEADRLVTVYNSYPKAGVERDGSSITNYYERRGQIPAFSSLSLYRNATAIVGESGFTEREQVVQVTPEFFSTLGLGPMLGRAFTERETSYQTDNVVILSDAYWRQHFNSDPGAIGRQLRMDGNPSTIVGILPPGFRFLSSEAKLFSPLSSNPEARSPQNRHSGGNSKHMIARLASEATLGLAQAQIDAQNAALGADNPKEQSFLSDAGFRSVVAGLHADHVAGIRPVLLWMQAGAIALLLIGAVNLMNLLLVRANGRMKEVAVRQALGASRLHVVSEAFVETTFLTMGGGLLGLAVGAAGIQLLAALGADRLPLGSNIALDARSAAAAFVGALLLGVLLAAPIVWLNLRGHSTATIRSEARGATSSRAAQRLRHAFIVAQIALALVLLSGAGILGLSLERAMAVSPGFRPGHVLTSQISVPWSSYRTWPDRVAFNEKLLRQLATQPGVAATGIVNNVPLSGRSGKSAAAVKGHSRRAGEAPRGHFAYGVDGDYFAAMGFSLREGRFLTASDSRRAGRVCVVDEDFARYYWPGTSALGQLVFNGPDVKDDSEAYTVVGVVGNVKQAGLTDEVAQGAVYYPYAMRSDENLFVVIRTSLPPESLAMALQRTVRQIDPDLPLSDVRSMESRITDSLIAYRSPALTVAIFSVVAVLLTAIGTYGVLSYAVTQRRREIGLRMALGARPGQIRAQFLALAMRLLGAGIAAGLVGAWIAGESMRALLFHVPPVHLATLIGSVALIGLVALGACLIPSYRAARISPMEALAGDQ
ncbi:ABC transporter permease [Paludibaculum fermentans]|uniref:ABC transporter permease n=1 Tax=Paludibaculum fermentans TaxID=1473598 RepID=A0A7S7NRG0_PALFE|nr:ABC transporter permease [Paludibaculum fermentans]QOY88350.1 ABC transporter permease [Paludibaculum fermentans]